MAQTKPMGISPTTEVKIIGKDTVPFHECCLAERTQVQSYHSANGQAAELSESERERLDDASGPPDPAMPEGNLCLWTLRNLSPKFSWFF